MIHFRGLALLFNLLLAIGLMASSGLLAPVLSCNPEPGAIHCPVAEPPPPRPSGYWIAYTMADGLLSERITCIDAVVEGRVAESAGVQAAMNGGAAPAAGTEEDEEGITILPQSSFIVAAGTEDSGLVIRRNGMIECHTVESTDGVLPSNSIRDLVIHKEAGFTKVIMATSEGPCVLTLDTMDFSRPKSPEEVGSLFTAVGAHKFSVIFGTDRAVWDMGSSQFTTLVTDPVMAMKRNGIVNSEPLSICHNKDNGFYIGFADGLKLWDGKMTPVEIPGIGDSPYISNMTRTERYLALCSVKGLLINDGLNWYNLNTTAGLPSDWVTAAAMTNDFRIESVQSGLMGMEDNQELSFAGQGAADSVLIKKQLQVLEDQRNAMSDMKNNLSDDESLRSKQFEKMWKAYNEYVKGIMKLRQLEMSLTNSYGLWVGTERDGLAVTMKGQLSVLNTDNSPITSNQFTGAKYFPEDGIGWFSTNGGGILKFLRNGMVMALTKPLKVYDSPVYRIRAKGGRFYCATERDGVYVYEVTGNTGYNLLNRTKGLELPGHLKLNGRDIDFDDDGTLFAALKGIGLVVIHGDKGYVVGEKQGIPSTELTSVHCPSTGTAWVGYEGGGPMSDRVFRYESGQILRYGTDWLNLYAGMSEGEFKAKVTNEILAAHLKDLIPVVTSQEPPYDVTSQGHSAVTSIVQTDYYTLFATEKKGLTLLRDRHFHQAAPNKTVFTENINMVTRDKAQRILVAAGRQAFYHDGQAWGAFVLPPQIVEVKVVKVDPANPDAIWVGGMGDDGKGIAILVPPDNAPSVFELPAVVNDLSSDSKHLFAGTNQGLYLVKIRD